MTKRLAVFAAVLVSALAVSASALAFDCMRVSSSAQGLQQSASNSGMWLYFDMTDSGNGVAQILEFFGLPSSTAPCFQAAYDSAVAANPKLPLHFALGDVIRVLRERRGGEEKETITEDSEGS